MRCGAGFHAHRRSAYFVDKILKGAKFVGNRQNSTLSSTLRRRSLETPSTILALADEVIE